MLGLLSALSLVLLFVYSQKSEQQIADEISLAVESKFADLYLYADQIEQANRLDQRPEGIDYVIYNVRGDVLLWSDHSYIPPFEYFPFRTSDYIITNEQGEFLYNKRRISWKGKDAYLVVLTMVRRKFNQSSTYLEDIYNTDILAHNIRVTDDPGSIPIKYEGEELFRIESNGQTYYGEGVNDLITAGLILLLICGLILIFFVAQYVSKKRGFAIAISVLVVLLVALRGLMSWIVLPDSFVKMDIFQQSTFTYRWLYYTLGDTVINFALVLVVLVFAIFYGRAFVSDLSGRGKTILGAFFLLLSYLAFFLILHTITRILSDSQISLDIASSMVFTFERVVCYFLICLLSVIFFCVHYLAYMTLSTLQTERSELYVLHIGVGLVSFVFFFWSANYLLAFGLNVIYILGLYAFNMPQSLKSLKFESINYLMFTVVLLSIGGAFEIYKSHERNELFKMQKFVTFLHIDRDAEGEYLLSNILTQIKQDIVVNSKMINPQSQLQTIERKIKRTYLNTYFSDYEIDIHLFDKNGIGLSKKYRGMSYLRVKKRYQQAKYETDYENVFYDDQVDINKRKRYICFTEISRYGSISGYVEIELRLKRFSSKRVLPQLLQDRSIRSSSNYNSAIISSGDLIYVSGDFPYEASFDTTWLANDKIYGIGLERDGARHLAAQIGDLITLVSTPVYPTRDIVSNFSFLFVVLLSLTVIIGIARYLGSHQTSNLNFSTKILIFTCGSFALPLVLVAVAIITSTDSSYRKEIDKNQLKSALLLAENVNDIFVEYEIQRSSRENLENNIAELSSNSSMDIDVYDTRGKLLASSTPEIYESGIISEYINPSAFASLSEYRKDHVVKEESIGSFLYKTIYVSVNSPEDGSVLGYLAVPYFGSRNHIESQQLIVFSNIIIIFTFVFILSIGLAYYVISRLTRPIMIIADRLHDTGFMQTNQPIDWESDDEIGELVHEYNNMLKKLEATKEELARNEKEAAWREMAKQVAHEIKNPLTPMKLTIQHLSRILGSEERDKKSLDILLSQIDTLDEIVTSFSHFAKMPTPLKEPFDIGQVLERSVNLHVDKNIDLDMQPGNYKVEGDVKLFGRIFNNLILNAFQAMKREEEPLLKVKLVDEGSSVLISFQDRGEGISEEIKEKVFIPNFSTKESGSGIGLAVAKRGIEHAGGSIWFESLEGQGTTFYIRMEQAPE